LIKKNAGRHATPLFAALAIDVVVLNEWLLPATPLLVHEIEFQPDLEDQASESVGEGDLSTVFGGVVTVPKALASPRGYAVRWKLASAWASEVCGLAA
jgi:hypothetical protein